MGAFPFICQHFGNSLFPPARNIPYAKHSSSNKSTRSITQIVPLLILASSLLVFSYMKPSTLAPTPQSLGDEIQAYVVERQSKLLASGEASRDGRRFSWCGDILDFLTEGLDERLAARDITFTNAFPGPLRLMDEEQQPNGEHVRRFWTIALHRGCPIARICTLFFHRHDQVKLPQPPRVVAYTLDHQDGEEQA